MWSWLNLYPRRYFSGPGMLSVPATSESNRAQKLVKHAMKPITPVLRLLVHTRSPLLSFNSHKYVFASLINGRQNCSFWTRSGALAKVSRLFRMSNTVSTMRMNRTVVAQNAKSSKPRLSRQNSSASATDELNVWAAEFTFIFCFVQLMCLSVNQFPALRPSFV